jgi:hypothetical protein
VEQVLPLYLERPAGAAVAKSSEGKVGWGCGEQRFSA